MSIERVDYNGKIDWKVFLPTAAGPTQCYPCLENDSATCSAIQPTQTCATDPASLGTTHCGFGAGIYRDALGNTSDGVMRGWINCAGNKFEILIVKRSHQIKTKYVKETAVDCQTVDTYSYTWLYLIRSLYFMFTWFNLVFFLNSYMRSFFAAFFMKNIVNFIDLLIQINAKRVRGRLAILKHCEDGLYWNVRSSAVLAINATRGPFQLCLRLVQVQKRHAMGKYYWYWGYDIKEGRLAIEMIVKIRI